MKRILKRLLISALLTGLFYLYMHLDEHPRSDYVINMATAACGLVCVLFSVLED